MAFLFVPFFQRNKREPLLNHRPQQFSGVPVRSLANSLNISVFEYADRYDALESDYLLVCGANILESGFANSGKILNCHAGLIPEVRGLDSFKWAIKEKKPVGNTLHIIDNKADMGSVLHQMETPLFADDSLDSFARRHYEHELWLLSNFDRFLSGGRVFDLPVSEPKRRMPRDLEKELPIDFIEYKSKFANS